MSKDKFYSTRIVLHDHEMIVECTVLKGHAGDRLTPPEPDDLIINNIYIGSHSNDLHDITLLVEEGGLMEEVQRLTEENYY